MVLKSALELSPDFILPGTGSHLHQLLQLTLVDAGMPGQELQLLGQDGDTLGTAAEKWRQTRIQVLTQDFHGRGHGSKPVRASWLENTMWINELRCPISGPWGTPPTDDFLILK